MNKVDIETAVIQLGDVGTCIDMVDRYFADGNAEAVDRSIAILKEIYNSRLGALREVCEL